MAGEPEWFRTCAQCGKTLSLGERHPVHTDRDDGFRLYAFCDEDCRSAYVERDVS
jgi:hypothetical protein